jgi:hypothetical protein
MLAIVRLCESVFLNGRRVSIYTSWKDRSDAPELKSISVNALCRHLSIGINSDLNCW